MKILLCRSTALYKNVKSSTTFEFYGHKHTEAEFLELAWYIYKNVDRFEYVI